jgi:hypothetical protein
MEHDQEDALRCSQCGERWDAAVPTDGSEPCPHCGSTVAPGRGTSGVPVPPELNPEMMNLQFITPRPPLPPSALAAMGPYAPIRAQSPARWAEDPTGRNRLRWWDGVRWTEWVANGEEATTDPL